MRHAILLYAAKQNFQRLQDCGAQSRNDDAGRSRRETSCGVPQMDAGQPGATPPSKRNPENPEHGGSRASASRNPDRPRSPLRTMSSSRAPVLSWRTRPGPAACAEPEDGSRRFRELGGALASEREATETSPRSRMEDRIDVDSVMGVKIRQISRLPEAVDAKRIDSMAGD